MEEHDNRLTTGRRSEYERDNGRSSFLAANQWTDVFFSKTLFRARYVRGNKGSFTQITKPVH